MMRCGTDNTKLYKRFFIPLCLLKRSVTPDGIGNRMTDVSKRIDFAGALIPIRSLKKIIASAEANVNKYYLLTERGDIVIGDIITDAFGKEFEVVSDDLLPMPLSVTKNVFKYSLEEKTI